VTEPRYPYVVVDVDADETDDAGARLFALGAEGIEERDATTLLLAQASGKSTLVASFPSHVAAESAIALLPTTWKPRLDEVVGDAWRDEWKRYFHPFSICPGIVVRPPWEARASVAGETVLALEPGRAFGTGLHETTALVARVLFARRKLLQRKNILDVGCGSGILSLVALALGAASARAVDVDHDAVLVTRENATRNEMEGRVLADTTDVRFIREHFPVVLANIEAHVLVPLAEAIGARVAPGGMLVLSGVLDTQVDDVCAAYPGFERDVELQKGEWVAIVLRRPR
jgi:ribosomal protein L11 methyltransferase